MFKRLVHFYLDVVRSLFPKRQFFLMEMGKLREVSKAEYKAWVNGQK